MNSAVKGRLTTERDVPRHLLDKYTKSGPRYTSYPTAPQFKADFDLDAMRERWRGTNQPGKGLSLYCHIPFCLKRCHFCGCHLEVGNSRHKATEYVDCLLSETDAMTGLIDPARPVKQAALGGGTPTFLMPDVMEHLVNGLKQRFNFAPDIEQSIEIDPLTVDEHYLDVLSGLGFNRYSFGVQDFDEDVQEAVGRVQDEAKIRRNVRHLQSIGHSAINLDFIYGLPHQTVESFKVTVHKVVELRPSRLAVYGYAHVPWVSPHQKQLEQFHLPTPDERVEIFAAAAEILLDAGYLQIGMDHFALPGDELFAALESHTLNRNFMGYSTKRGLDLVGLGASSISYVGSSYAQNEKAVRPYMDKAASIPWVKGLLMTREDELRGEVILELMCNLYLDIAAIETKHGISFARHFAAELAELEPMQADGLLRVGPGEIQVTELGKFFVRNISMCFDEYLKKDGQAAAYSRTV
jgi:oxygen-independent coproporphyrinogen III oxidase